MDLALVVLKRAPPFRGQSFSRLMSNALVGAFVGRLDKGQKSPARHHAGTAHADKGQGYAGERQQVGGAENIETGLKDKHASYRAGGDGIQGRTAGSADGPGVKRQAGDDSRDDNGE